MATEVRSLIERIADADEVWEERRFTIYRNGESRPLTLTISDQGEYAGSFRYSVLVEGVGPTDSVRATGNPAATVEDALHAVHWDQLN
ncbi:conserved hypothetical protein [Curtobacterium sp. 8I-2]|nr:conserved hypothetical protein [Curtobacterium sp. 8I-2]